MANLLQKILRYRYRYRKTQKQVLGRAWRKKWPEEKGVILAVKHEIFLPW
jgi:hypothetical protein